MPLYEYKCQRCNKLFEVIQKFADEPLTIHEGCGGTVARQFSAPALLFKGSGFYITDYGHKNGASPSKPTSKETPAPAAAAPATADTKK
jgi:putative FmdB family regulatory protein